MWVPCWCKGMSTSAMVGFGRSEDVGRTEGFRGRPRVRISGRNAPCSGGELLGVQCFYRDPGVMEKWRVWQTHHGEGVALTRHAGPVPSATGGRYEDLALLGFRQQGGTLEGGTRPGNEVSLGSASLSPAGTGVKLRAEVAQAETRFLDNNRARTGLHGSVF